MHVYLHIGTGKTGTTTVQNHMANNRGHFRKKGVLYPTTLGRVNHELAAVYGGDFQHGFTRSKAPEVQEEKDLGLFRRSLREKLNEEVAAGSYDKVIISNEHLFEKIRGPQNAGLIRHLISDFATDVTVILYIRRQDEFAAAIYAELVRMGFNGALQDCLAQERTKILLDYWGGVQQWIEEFGKDNIKVRVYDRERLENGDVVDDLSSIVGMDLRLRELGNKVVDTPNRRRTLDAKRTDFLRRFNDAVIQRTNETKERNMNWFKTVKVRGPLIKGLDQDHSIDTKFKLDSASAKSIIADHKADNDAMFATFEMQGFKQFRSKRDEQTTSDALQMDDVFSYFADIWLHDQTRIEK